MKEKPIKFSIEAEMKKKIIVVVAFLSIISGIAHSETTKRASERYPNGDLKQIIYFNAKGTELAKENFDDKGKRKVTGRIPDGVVKEYDKNGKLCSEYNFKDNKLNGLARKYNIITGSLEQEVHYLNDAQNGLDVKIFKGNGKIQSIDTYKKGRIINAKKYDETGRIVFDQDYPYEEEAVTPEKSKQTNK